MFSRNMVDIPEIFHWILGIMAQSSWHRKSITISSNLKIDLHLYLPWLRILSLSWRKGKSKLSQRIVDCFLSCSINTFFVVELLWQLNCSGSPTPCVCVHMCVIGKDKWNWGEDSSKRYWKSFPHFRLCDFRDEIAKKTERRVCLINQKK
jgi:hypothetical protein